MEETGKEEELQKFLGKVDEIDSIMKDLTCGDIERQNKALNAADEFLKRHKAENDDDSDDECKQLKTVCDRTDFPRSSDDPSAFFCGMERERAEVSQGSFMKAVKEDAKERVKVHKKCEVEAEKLKGKGNMAFKEGKFQEAISNYTMAISKTRTNPVLYTNRAQAHIKLGAYGAAIQDCDLALGIDKKCVKAFVHKARALQAQGKFDESISVLNKAIEVAPKQEKVLKGYISEAESARKRLQDEQDATSTGLGNGELIEGLMSRLKKDGLATSQYMDATRTLASLLNSNVNRTLFRCFGGFQIIDSNKTFKSYWEGSDLGAQFVEDVDLICEVIRTLMEACTDNDHNVEEFFKKDYSTSFNRLLRDPTSPVIRSAVTSLLHQLSQTKRGRLKLVACKDIKWVAEALFSLVQRGTNIAVVAMSTINNLALQEGFCEKIRDLVDKDFLRISQRFVLKLCGEDRLRPTQPTDHWSLVSSGLSALANMAKDAHIRNKIADDQAWWETSVKFLDHYYHEIQDQKVRCSIYSILALLANISIQPCQYQKDVAPRLIPSLIELLSTGYDEIAERSIAALRHLLANSEEALNHACDLKIHIHVLRILKLVILSSHFQGGWGAGTRETVKKYAIKCLALCTMERKDAREGVISEKALDYLLQMLHSTDETIIGNTALCLGHCADMVEVSQHFVGSAVVELLLKHGTNDELSDDVKQNAAICLARLATSDSRHLERLKEMHGLEILHSVIQNTNLS